MTRNKRKQRPSQGTKLAVQKAVGRWYESNGAIYRFGFTFLGLAFLFNTAVLLPVWEKPMVGFVNANAHIASFILNLVGERSHALGGIIYSPQYAITVLPACTAVEFSGIFCAAVAAFPTLWSRKIIGMAAGVALLTALNLLRIISLYFVGVHLTSLFTTMHEQIWGVIQIPAIVLLAIAWAQWAIKNDHLEIRSSN